MLSLGVPMILMGDEVRRTQRGNNNAYCQDNEISWFDWTLLAKHADVHRFVSLLAARRSLRDVEHERQRVSLNTFLREANKAWHGVKLNQPDWGDCSHSLALSAELRREGLRLSPDLERVLGAARVRVAEARRWRTRGDDGSTRPSTRRTTSSRGRRHRRFRAAPIGSSPLGRDAVHGRSTWGESFNAGPVATQ